MSAIGRRLERKDQANWEIGEEPSKVTILSKDSKLGEAALYVYKSCWWLCVSLIKLILVCSRIVIYLMCMNTCGYQFTVLRLFFCFWDERGKGFGSE